jgi:DNA helicase II / ATP-dependent DNA helicase PcrA
MYNTLSDKQKEIVDCSAPRIIVKACPGSGKTYSVTARLSKLLEQEIYRHHGIAVLSFTNNACNEIKGYLKDLCHIEDLGYPHFIGTFDSFINNYIFLPFGHLYMECNSRPEIVGTEYNKWYEFDYSKTKVYDGRVSYRDPNYYFDKASFDKEDKLIPLCPSDNYHFGEWDNQRNKNRQLKKVFQDITDSKNYHFSQGKANQADANYIAYKLLIDYPQLATNLANRFPTIIVDEAQDTTQLQMTILDILNANGLKNLMLIGDPDQAIFEWNTANPELFIEKYKDENHWHRIPLNENRRSSLKICNVLNNFFKDDMISVSENKECALEPQIQEHDETKKTVLKIRSSFLEECQKEGIPSKEIAVVFRGLTFGTDFFDLANDKLLPENLPWSNGKYFVREIVNGKYLIDNGMLKEGLKLIEKGYQKYKDESLKYVSAKFIQDQINSNGFRNYRKELFNFIERLPCTQNKTLKNWISEVKQKCENSFAVNNGKSDILINQLFFMTEQEKELEYHLNTIHSVKGSTYDAILVFLKKSSASSDYKKILSENYKKGTSPDTIKKDREEFRIVYVACSRPRKLLWLAVNFDDRNVWKKKLIEKQTEPIQTELW